MTIVQTDIDAAVASSATLSIPEGLHQQPGPLVMDMSVVTASAGAERKRPNIEGRGHGTTTLQTYGSAPTASALLKVSGGTSNFGAHQTQVLRDFSLNHGSGGWASPIGVHLFNSAFISLQNMGFFNLDIGLKLESHLSAGHSNLHFRGNAVGIELSQGSGSSPANALRFHTAVFHWASKWAIKGLPTSYGLSLDGINVESCGTHGDMATGGIQHTSAGGRGLHLRDGWFEANGGSADIVLINTNPNVYSTHVIEGCYFIRTSDSQFTVNNIKTVGKHRLVLIGNHFQGTGTYVANSARKYVQPDVASNVVVTCIGNEFTSSVEKGSLANI